MKKVNFTLCFLLVIGLFLTGIANGQSYIAFSKYAGGSAFEDVEKILVVNGETYVAGNTESPDFPVTNGSTYKAGSDIVFTKYSATGTVIYSTYLGSFGYDNFITMKIINGEVYILATADSTGYPVTNGSSYRGKTDVVVTRLNASGQIVFSTYIGGSNNDNPTNSIYINGNQVIVAGFTTSVDFPVTSGTYNGGIRDGFVFKLNATTGALISSLFIGGNLEDNVLYDFVDNGSIFLVGTTMSTDMPVTIGSLPGTEKNVFAVKINSNNFNIDYYRYIGGVSTQVMTIADVLNGELHFAGWTMSHNFPVTNGSVFSGSPIDYIDGYYTKLNSDGSIGFSTYLGTEGSDFISQLVLSSNGDAYIAGISLSNIIPAHRDVEIFKINNNGSFGYVKQLSIGTLDQAFSLKPVNGDLYVSGITGAADFPVTNVSQYYSGSTGYFTHLDASGNILYSTFLGKMSSLLPLQFSNNRFYLLGQTDLSSYPVTDSSTIHGSVDNILAILSPDGTNIFGTYIGGSIADISSQLAIDNNDIYLSGITNSPDYPVTNNTFFHGEADQFLTKLSFCPPGYDVINDTLTPKEQIVCKFGLAQVITGVTITVPSSVLPTIYLNGVPSSQTALVEASYQWQTANSPGGPWTNIPTATFKDYRPVVGGSNQFYRRLSFSPADCGSSLIHTSDTAAAIVSNLAAPDINMGGPFVTCPGSAITIGGSPTASAGNPPYTSYIWDMGADPVANPTVAPLNNTIYTLIVTDAAGCQQIGQAIVLTYRANAGPDRGNCAGNPVQIGTSQATGVAGIDYSWQPGTDLTSTTIAQPFANPPAPTDYELTLTIPKSGGGICNTKDTVRVSPVATPVTANFAGPDRVICFKDHASLGTAPEAGYTYTWSPGSYLTSNTTSTTSYYSGNIVMPSPNPATLFLTAQKGGCSFSDEVVVSTIESRAGFLACGPRIVGLPDRTPGINETYAWTKLSGPGNFTGATNLPQVPVSASVGGTTTYGLTVSYNGGSCFSQVDVPELCVGCNTFITVEAQYKCPSFNVNFGNVTLHASTSLQNPVFTWTPQAGLSAYTGSSVQLTDNVPRTYTVTATDINDTSIHCSYQMTVNDPAFSLPVFTAPDVTACANVPITIGQAPVAGYTYLWTGPGLSNNTISNPLATIPFETSYLVKVTDGNGCALLDTVVVNVQNILVNAGQDWAVCSNAVIQLGTAAQPNTNYLWEPQSSPWQNGTSQFSAQPEVLAAAATTYTVTATTSAGCISTDTVHVTINDIPVIPDAANQLLCLHNNVMIGSPSLPGVIYQWSPATGLSNASIAQPLASPAVTTTYTLVAIFPGSCISTANDQVTVTVSNPSFNIPDINFCPADGAVALGINAPVNMLSYTWAPSQLLTDAHIANPSTLDPPPNITTHFTLTAVNADGCSYTDTVTIIPSTAAPIAGPDRTICRGQSTTIGSAANTSGPLITYTWIPSVNIDDPSNPNPVFTGTAGGVFTYVLIKTDNSVACSSTDTITITVTDALIPPMNSPTVCQNSCVQIGTTPLPGIQYQWTPATGLSDAGIANPLACVVANAVSYTLTASDFNGCSSSANVVVGVNNLPAPQINIPTVTACLGDNNVTFNPVINPAGSYSYLWSPDNGTLTDINILTPGIIITGTGNTAYTLQVTDNNTGCDNTGIANLIVNSCPPVAIVGDYLWFDSNTNGLQDPSELGVSGMTVRLYNNLDFNVATTVTDANGLYFFTNVPPGNNYYVTFERPTGFVFTTQNVGGTAALNNSKVNTNGRSINFNLAAGASVLNIDAGIIPEGCGPVPVTLLSFTGTLHNREVLLNWQTTAEYNNNYFDVERSNDGINYIAIGRVNGNGTTQLPHSYSFIDHHPLTGINFYRLKQVDFDSHATYSNIVPIELNADQVITTYYNNADNTIRISFSDRQNNVHVKLYANNGQLIKSAIAPNNITAYTFELPLLATGIYVLQIINEQFNFSKRILVNKQ